MFERISNFFYGILPTPRFSSEYRQDVFLKHEVSVILEQSGLEYDYEFLEMTKHIDTLYQDNGFEEEDCTYILKDENNKTLMVVIVEEDGRKIIIK